VRLDDGDAAALLDELRRDYLAAPLDRPADMPADPRGPGILERRVKERFDPDGRLV